MADEKLEWVFDSLVEFLRGPIWNIPVLTFIEQKSVVFEPGAENEEELKKIHEAYKNLVDFMLGSYMEDLKISPEEFEKSCSAVSKKVLNQFHQSLFQQVWAADDFEIFKRMMTQKNLELQLQALEFLTQKRGSVPNCMEPVLKISGEKEMEEIIKKVIVESQTELELATPADAVLKEQMKQVAQKEKELLEQAIQQSVRGKTNREFKKDSVQEEEEIGESKEEIHESEEEFIDSKEEISESNEEIKEPEEEIKEPEEEIEEPEEEIEEPEVQIGEPEEEIKEHGEEINKPDEEIKGLGEEINEVEEIENNAEADLHESNCTVKNESEGSDNELEKMNNQSPNVAAAEIDLKNDSDKCENKIMAIKIEECSIENISSKAPTSVKESEERPWSEGDSSEYSTVQVEVSPLELERRQNYLRQQRDRILALKKQERARRLSTSEEIVQARPKSARAAKKMLREETTEIDPQTLVFRKTLAAKLRNEVVDKSD